MYRFYNQAPNECSFPTRLVGQSKECNFMALTKPIIENPGLQNNEEVVLPKNTVLYHATTVYPNEVPWFLTSFPQNKTKGYVWFTSSLDHTGIHNYTHVLRYVLQDDLKLKFIQNLMMTGNDYIQTYSDDLSTIDGYVSCNECEIAIKNESVIRALAPTFQIVKTKDMKYID